MTCNITTWLRAYFVLQATAGESRGFLVADTDTDELVRWPRTKGYDVIAIAAIVDPYVRALPLRFGGHGIACRWRHVVDELEHTALLEPRSEYAGNRTFWRALPALFVYLHAEGVPVPSDDTWQALLALLLDATTIRNVGPKGDGPFKHFDNVKTFDELYIAQYKYLRELRGADDVGTFKIPHSTNSDVAALASYWSKQLADTKEVFGHKAVVERWKRTVADVDALARNAQPEAVYAKNAEFWRALKSTAIHVAAADEAPTGWDLAKDALKDSIKQLPTSIKEGAGKAATAVAGAAGELAQGIGNIANHAGRGLFAGFGTPMLVGAGLLGLFLVSRSRARAEHAS